jgi:hypothetical protein
MANNPQNDLCHLLKNATPVRYFDGKDQLAEQQIKILQSDIVPVGVCLYGGPYDRLIDVTNRVGTITDGRKVYAAGSDSLTAAIEKLPRQERPDREMERSYSFDPCERLIGRLLSLKCKTVVITGAEELPKDQFSLLNAALETLSTRENYPKILLIFEGPVEKFNALLNNGAIPWAVQICRPLTYQDMVEFLKIEGVSLDEGFLADEASVTLLAAACKNRPQGMKRLANALVGTKVTCLNCWR